MGQGRRDKVYLTSEQRQRLEEIRHNGHAPAKKIVHAQILLMCDEGPLAERRWTDVEIAAVLNIHRNTVDRVRKRFLDKGEYPALNRSRRKHPPTPPKVDGALEAQIIALCCSDPPDGNARWSLRLLTSELQRRKIVLEISRETIRRTLKKQTSSLENPAILYP